MLIDGTRSEGGGQILRTAAGLAARMSLPCRFTGIRAGREQPGLREQHLQSMEALARYVNGELSGARIGAMDVTFAPGQRREESLAVSIRTAGSITLLIQPFLLAVRPGESLTLEISGGATHTRMAPPVEYINHVLAPLLRAFGVDVSILATDYGFYPPGGAIARCEIRAGEPQQALRLVEPGPVTAVRGVSLASEHLRRARVAERQAESAAAELAQVVRCPIRIDTRTVPAPSPGSAVVLWAEGPNRLLGADALGQKGHPAEAVGREAATRLWREIEAGACVDAHAADMIAPFIALSDLPCAALTSEATRHLTTNIDTARLFLGPRIRLDGTVITSTNADGR